MSVFAALAEGRHPRKYQAGQVIYLQGTSADEFYYLAQGQVRSYISSQSGGERILTIHRTGDLMGEASFFDECPRVSSAVAITDCLVVSINRASLDHIFQQHPELALPMLQYLARTVRLLSSHVDAATFLPAGQRLARYLYSEAEAGVPFPCTHEELGFAIGVSRVTISRLLSDLADLGVIKTGYRSITILNREELRKKSGDF